MATLVLLFTLPVSPAAAQGGNTSGAAIPGGPTYREKTFLHADRGTYLTGETTFQNYADAK